MGNTISQQVNPPMDFGQRVFPKMKKEVNMPSRMTERDEWKPSFSLFEPFPGEPCPCSSGELFRNCHGKDVW